MIIRILIILSLIVTCLQAQEIRTGIDYSYFINKRTSFELMYQKRLYNAQKLQNFSDVYQYSGNYYFKKRFGIGSSVRYTAYDQESNTELQLKDYNDKYRYTFDLSYETKRINGYKHKIRLRYQHADLSNEKRNDHLRIRYTANYKISENIKFKTYPEIFYRLDKDRVNSVRVTSSMEAVFNKLSFELFYTMERHWKMKGFEYYNIIGLSIHLESGNKK